MLDTTIPQSLVLDFGTACTKAGWSNQGESTFQIPSVVGRGRHKGAMLTLGLKDSYVGRQAQQLRGILSLRQPFKQGLVQHWDDLEILWDYIWNQACSKVPTNDGKVLVSVPPLCPASDWRRLAEIILETPGVGGVYLANKSVLSMYGGGRTTGVCVDSGEDMTYIVPCLEGSPLPDATLILKMGGKHVTDRLLSLLTHGKYSFPDDTFLLWKRGGRSSNRFTVASRRDVVREAKERFCKVAPASNTTSNEEEQVLRLPDGNIVVVGNEAFQASEVLFQPELAKKKYSGLHELVHASVMKCDEKVRPMLLSNIMLTGGNSLLSGLDARLANELTKLFPKNTKVKVQAQNGRENFTWDGGAHLCGLSSFQRLWLTKQDYKESGLKGAGTGLTATNGENGADEVIVEN